MADDRYVLKPLTSEGGRGPRLEIDEFLSDNEMTNLFLIALGEMQKDSLRKVNGKPDWLTFYSLAGIHGQPQEEWNGFANNVRYGYCHHSMNTFPLWHRPYMFLYESAIHQEMLKQANLYLNESDKKTYLAAAARFRLPYWDIIMPRNEQAVPPSGQQPDPKTIWGCPDIFKKAKVFVKLPKPDPQTVKNGFSEIDNPLGSFNYPTTKEYSANPDRKVLKLGSGVNQVRTTRVPTQKSKNETDNDALDLVIQRQAGSSANTLWQMLNPDLKQSSPDDPNKVEILVNQERSWNSFANDTISSDPIKGYSYATVSVESFHDRIHNLLGTGAGLIQGQGYSGAIGNPRTAAFDPIFWMHHNNIERLLCLYQALVPGRYLDGVDSQSQLYPFMTGKGRECYKPTDDLVKNYWGSGFATPGDTKLDPNAVKAKVKEYLTKNYYWATNSKIVPGSLEKWPKYLKGSWALYGSNAVPNPAPVLHVNAITQKAGKPELVARSIPVAAPSSQIHDQVIEVPKVLEVAHAVDKSLPSGALTAPASTTNPPLQVTWNAHVKVRKFAFNGSFSTHLFIGHVKDDQPERYMTKKNEVGFTGVFATDRDTSCASCLQNQAQDIIVEDVIPITTALYDYLDATPGSGDLIRDGQLKTIPDLDVAHVVPFLTEHLQWRMTDLSARLLANQEQQAKLEIMVTSRQFLPPTEGNPMGVYGPFTPHLEITRNKPGGFGYVYPTA